MVGCQIVALNYQTEDIPTFIEQSLFAANGSCGYLLKPDILRDPNIKYDPDAPFPQDRGVTLTIRLISGQHIPKAPGTTEVVDPYVELWVFGHEGDKAKEKSEVVDNNGFNPIWNETFKFRIHYPELALIYFRVKDYSSTSADQPLAHFALPVNSITTGYRHIHLENLRCEPLVPSTLFVHVAIEDHQQGKAVSNGVNGMA
jgi:hypothetical protein